jgi:hypothetical protein
MPRGVGRESLVDEAALRPQFAQLGLEVGPVLQESVEPARLADFARFHARQELAEQSLGLVKTLLYL